MAPNNYNPNNGQNGYSPYGQNGQQSGYPQNGSNGYQPGYSQSGYNNGQSGYQSGYSPNGYSPNSVQNGYQYGQFNANNSQIQGKWKTWFTVAMWILVGIQCLALVKDLLKINDMIYASQFIGGLFLFYFFAALVISVGRIVFEILIILRKKYALLGYIIVVSLDLILYIVLIFVYGIDLFGIPSVIGTFIGAAGFPALIAGLAYSGVVSTDRRSPYRK